MFSLHRSFVKEIEQRPWCLHDPVLTVGALEVVDGVRP
jgi:hypothetical protein